jgi:choline/ethanolamine kinase
MLSDEKQQVAAGDQFGAIPRSKHWIHSELIKDDDDNISINFYPFKVALLYLIHKTVGVWSSLGPQNIVVERMTQAFSNIVLKISTITTKHADTLDNNEPRALIVKIHGYTEVALKELRWLRVLSGAGPSSCHAPALLAEFGNGHIEECIDGSSLTFHEMRNVEIAKDVMRAMKRMHESYKFIGGQNDLFNRVERWRLKAASSVKDSNVLSRFSKVLDSSYCKTVIDPCQNYSSDQFLVISHNDLQMGNILRNKESGLITFVDYEYSNIAPRGFDLANYFLEWMADYSDQEHRELMDRTNFPSAETRRELLAAYLGDSGEGLKELEDELKPFLNLSHLLWTLWAINQSSISKIDFDYLSYAQSRYAFLP